MKNILVIGGGSIGERHLRCFLKTGRAKVSLCELRPEIRERIEQEYDVAATFDSLEAALAESLDAAVICTPANLHIKMAQQLAEKKLSLLIEKPLSIATDGIDKLLQTVDENELSASIAYVYRAHPVLQSMKAAIDSGRFGKPVQVVMSGGQHFPFYRPAYREIYYTKHETGGGAIQDAMTHMLNAAEWLVGPITKLVADADHCVLEGVDVEDTVHIIARHKSVLASYNLNQHQAPNETSIAVICKNGTAKFEANKARWISCSEPGKDWDVELSVELERDDLFINQANAFLDHLEVKQPAACSLSEGLQTLKVNLAALESVRTGNWVTI
ncbi:Gfo/Idh/MocA family protein [Thalassoglobus polymorphus]|uniref:4,5-dihydroxyphthalate dehydrogenase n=1 Tax=Thalassoglobus polymorphus TaxID=2527994 RepID=A0A517QV35_9PLAN|nr:Gfo/Idh/MocA family oxidoreductase [Thalassoglobus polymorphus]QDT35480.1 Putative 4,5-dihydroxyphthalate dehydrogenase [Thalassoglobus polymorphus]